MNCQSRKLRLRIVHSYRQLNNYGVKKFFKSKNEEKKFTFKIQRPKQFSISNMKHFRNKDKLPSDCTITELPT